MPSTAPSFIDDGLSNIQLITYTAPRVRSTYQQTKNTSHHSYKQDGERKDASSKTKVSMWMMDGAMSDSESCIDDSCSFLCDPTHGSRNTFAAVDIERTQDWETKSIASSCIDDGASTVINFQSGRRAQPSTRPARLKTVQEEVIADQQGNAVRSNSVTAPVRRATILSQTAPGLSANLRRALRDDIVRSINETERPIPRHPFGKENKALHVQAPPDMATFVVRSKDGTTVLVNGTHASVPVRRASAGQPTQRTDLLSAPIPFVALQRHEVRRGTVSTQRSARPIASDEVARSKRADPIPLSKAPTNRRLSKQVDSSRNRSKKATTKNKQEAVTPKLASPAASEVPPKGSTELDRAASGSSPQSRGSLDPGLAALEVGDAGAPESPVPSAIPFAAPAPQIQDDRFMSGALANNISLGEHDAQPSIPKAAFVPPFMPTMYPVGSPTPQGATSSPIQPFPTFDPNYPPFGYSPPDYRFPPTGSGFPYFPPPPPPPPPALQPSNVHGSVPTPTTSNYRAPTVESVRSSRASSVAGGGGYIALRRTIGATDGGGGEYCNATWGGIPVRVADWRGSSGAGEEEEESD